MTTQHSTKSNGSYNQRTRCKNPAVMDSKLTVWYFGLVGCGTVNLECRYQGLVRTCCLHLQVGTKAQTRTSWQAPCYFPTVSEIRLKAVFQSTVITFAVNWDWTKLFDWKGSVLRKRRADSATLNPDCPGILIITAYNRLHTFRHSTAIRWVCLRNAAVWTSIGCHILSDRSS